MNKWKKRPTESKALHCFEIMNPIVKKASLRVTFRSQNTWKTSFCTYHQWSLENLYEFQLAENETIIDSLRTSQQQIQQYCSTQEENIKRLTRASDLIVGLTIKFGSGCSITGLETIGTPGCRWVGGLGASCYGVNLRKLQFTTWFLQIHHFTKMPQYK